MQTHPAVRSGSIWLLIASSYLSLPTWLDIPSTSLTKQSHPFNKFEKCATKSDTLGHCPANWQVLLMVHMMTQNIGNQIIQVHALPVADGSLGP